MKMQTLTMLSTSSTAPSPRSTSSLDKSLNTWSITVFFSLSVPLYVLKKLASTCRSASFLWSSTLLCFCMSKLVKQIESEEIALVKSVKLCFVDVKSRECTLLSFQVLFIACFHFINLETVLQFKIVYLTMLKTTYLNLISLYKQKLHNLIRFIYD